MADRPLSLWHDTLPPGDDLTPRPALPGDRETDVAIVGAGFTGLWTARYLRRLDPSVRVTLLEATTAGFGLGFWATGATGFGLGVATTDGTTTGATAGGASTTGGFGFRAAVLGFGAVSQDVEAVRIDALRIALEEICRILGGGARSEPQGYRHIVLQCRCVLSL